MKGLDNALQDIQNYERGGEQETIYKNDDQNTQILDTKEVLLATVSHEIRTPLNAIIGITELLHSSTALTTEQQEYIEIIHKCSDQLLSVINDILDYSKITAKKMALVATEFNLIALIDECIDTVNIQAFKKQLNLYKNIAPNMPEFVIGDEKRIKQVLTNILCNAVKFTSKGSVTLKADYKVVNDPYVNDMYNDYIYSSSGNIVTSYTNSFHPSYSTSTENVNNCSNNANDTNDNIKIDEKHDENFTLSISNEQAQNIQNSTKLSIIFEIIDTGIGITKEKQQSIFESFSQINNQKFGTSEGTGLGLAISKNLINLHGGEIMVWSEPNVGSKFTFNFIVYLSATKIHYNTQYFAKKKVLIVDDDAINRLLYMHLFTEWQFQPMIATNGKETELLLEQHHFDLIVMDIQMKSNSGIEIGTVIRNKYKDIKMIALSSLGVVHKSINDKIFDYQAVKPVKKNILYGILICIFAPKNYNDLSSSSSSNIHVDNINNININTEINVCNNESLNYNDVGIDECNINTNFGAESSSKSLHLSAENIRILVAEDSKLNQLVIKKMLEQLKYCNVDIVENGAEVIDRVRECNYDLLLLDIKMPVMDGYETMYKLKNEFKKEHLPIIIAQTAHALETEKQKCLKLGINDYITKPFTIKDIKQIMRKYF